MSLEATDLRIGNLLMGYDKVPFKWELRHFDMVYDGIEADEIGMPIPITEEWLLRMGFATDGEDGFWNKQFENGSYLSFEMRYGRMELCRSMRAFSAIPMRSVHQVQNLIFVLTARELKITGYTEEK